METTATPVKILIHRTYTIVVHNLVARNERISPRLVFLIRDNVSITRMRAKLFNLAPFHPYEHNNVLTKK